MSIEGTVFGNILGIAFFFLFQASGIVLAAEILKKDSPAVKLLGGSVFGTVLLQWLPALFSFFVGFNVLSHALAALVVVLLPLFVGIHQKGFSLNGTFRWNRLYLFPAAVFLLFCFLVLHSFKIENGAVYSSQCTFGDMSMHLGFITSIANQGIFPPEYSILVGTPLSYPFLSDSISSSIYLFGASLRIAYVLPMFFAGAQVFGGFLLLMKLWLQNTGKAILAFVLFFVNGGLGFIYFLPGAAENPGNFTRIFTEFYQTPTNLSNENIRWVNAVVDMLVPQRATLFGWAVLFTALIFLYKGVYQEKHRRYFMITGILAGALPMIHTHSFLTLALISLCWLFFALWDSAFSSIRKPANVTAVLLVVFPFAMMITQKYLWADRGQVVLLWIVLAVLILLAVLVVFLWLVQGKMVKEFLHTWGWYLAVTLILALPQLFFWTFRQASGEYFTRGYFNWANNNDPYLWFYIKNIGIPALLFLPAVLWAGKSKIRILSPVLLIWFVAELVVFQPNEYDNNKLFYVAYIFICGLLADYLVELYRKLQGVDGRRLLAAVALLLCTASALLTFGREAVARYDLIDVDQVKAEQYIEAYAEPSAVILTDLRHNNGIAALAGRNLVCGSESYLYYHGLDYGGRPGDIQSMYEHPKDAQALFEKYGVAYVLVSSYERESYAVQEQELEALFPCVFESGNVRIFEVKEEIN